MADESALNSAGVVSAFLMKCSGGQTAFAECIRTHFVESTVWENVGLHTTMGIDEALAFLDELQSSAGLGRFSFEMLNLASVGGKVLTERIDRIFGIDDTERVALRSMGIFEVESGKILGWRNYPSQPRGRSIFEKPEASRASDRQITDH